MGGDERIVRFREVAVYRAAEIAGVTLWVEEAEGLAFDYDRSNRAARSHVCLLTVAAVVAAATAELLAVVLILPGLVLLLLLLGLLLLVSAWLAVAIAVPEPAEPSAPLAATLAAAVVATAAFAFRGSPASHATGCVRLAVLARTAVSLRLARHQRYCRDGWCVGLRSRF